MRNLLFLFAALSTLFFQSCKKIKGDGPVVSEHRSVNKFSSINSGIDGDIHFTPGNTYEVEVRAQQNIIDIIETKVSAGALKVSYTDHYNIGRHDRIDIYITCPSPESFTLSGAGNFDATLPLNVTDMRLRVSGSGSMNINNLTASSINAHISGSGDINVNSGSARTASYQVDGSGRMDLLEVMVNEVTTATRGSGDIRLHATDKLNVTITGSGNVIYKGNPAINTQIIGSGNIRRW
jgi:carbon monoxide dehydrogenase subunit G